MNRKIKTYKIVSIITGVVLLLFSLGMIVQLSIYSRNPHTLEFNALMSTYTMAIVLTGIAGLYTLVLGCLRIREHSAITIITLHTVFNAILLFPIFALTDGTISAWHNVVLTSTISPWVMTGATVVIIFSLFIPFFLAGVKPTAKTSDKPVAQTSAPKLNLEQMLEGGVITKDEYLMLLNQDGNHNKASTPENVFASDVAKIKQLRADGVLTTKEYETLFKEIVNKMK